ncbi:hypothetical protein [Marinomonas balearica]|uniref:Uncharacterized protein n=1 Tax=Marinomonas balearica TaxID=491947 RepID=A0A4R6M3I5_9GAMM|nr:hypothetical protein [Marinomonas balearica]TDO95556.1 hypothetical protein DFP79_3487 [Marinomonas balearica]
MFSVTIKHHLQNEKTNSLGFTFCGKSMVMSFWSHHYQAETVDLRYFFHNGWSS